ncbi:MAG TPA: hypothetical protein VF142_06830 [Longimicrobium sp.]
MSDELVVAVDVARGGADKSVLAVRRGMRLDELVVLPPSADLMATTGHVITELDRLGVRARDRRVRLPGELPPEASQYVRPSGYYWSPGVGTVVVDEVGVGGGLLDRLKEQHYHAVGFNGGRASRDRRKFVNLRAEAFWELRKLLEAGAVALPRDDQLWDELTALRWSVDSQGRVALEAKDALRDRIGRSPDKADAVAMCFWWRPGRAGVPEQRPVYWG